jgi:2-C-methyl-D-erythritol 4-phosphate cytidylyltransferase
MAVALIVAAGRGERLGSGRPKALVTVSGRPMVEWSISALRLVPEVDEIVVALPAEALSEAPAGVTAIAGGAVRSESVLLALRAASPTGDPVIVHDAARPLASPELFARSLAVLREAGADAAIAAAPVTDTVKEVADDGATVARTLDRARLWAVQTPQVFRREALERALDVPAEVLAAATDDAWLVERNGGIVTIVASDPGNLKITTPADLHVAEELLASR